MTGTRPSSAEVGAAVGRITRVRRYPHKGAEVHVLEDRGDRLKVSVGGMLGWCLKKELETALEEEGK